MNKEKLNHSRGFLGTAQHSVMALHRQNHDYECRKKSAPGYLLQNRYPSGIKSMEKRNASDSVHAIISAHPRYSNKIRHCIRKPGPHYCLQLQWFLVGPQRGLG